MYIYIYTYIYINRNCFFVLCRNAILQWCQVSNKSNIYTCAGFGCLELRGWGWLYSLNYVFIVDWRCSTIALFTYNTRAEQQNNRTPWTVKLNSYGVVKFLSMIILVFIDKYVHINWHVNISIFVKCLSGHICFPSGTVLIYLG